MLRGSRILSLSDFQLQILKCFLLVVIAYFAYSWFKKFLKLAETMNKIPGPKPQFLIGNLGILGVFSSTGNQHKDLELLLLRILGMTTVFKGGIFRVWIFFLPFICVFRHKTLETIFNNQSMGEKTIEYKLLEPIMGKGLITSHFAKNKKRRKLILPALSTKLIDDFLKTFNYHTRITVEKLYRIHKQDHVEVVPLFNLYSLDVICETALGVRFNSQNDGKSDYAKAICELDRMVLERGLRPWLWPDFIYYRSSRGKDFKKYIDYVNQYTGKLIKQRKKRFLKDKDGIPNKNVDDDCIKSRETMPFMDILLTEHMTNPEFTEHDVQEEVDTFINAGFDTITMSCSWVTFLLGLHPEIQEKVYDELYQIFGNDKERSVTLEDIKQMKYMECVIKESQRLYPSLPFVGKTTTEEIDIDGYKIPKGIGCYILIMALQRDPEVFPNPEVFDPDRFLPENATGRNPYTFIPFSAGVRSCVGQKYAAIEQRTSLAHILRNFSLKSLDTRDKILPYPDIVLRTFLPIRVKYTPRAEQ